MDNIILKATLIISVYNNWHWLKQILNALNCQTEKNFEVIIADDGSNNSFVDNLKESIKNYSFPIIHVWHEDKGWRKNEILNKAIQEARSQYLIFLDGDCIPHPHFIKDHVFLAHKGTVVAGRRVQLPLYTTKVIDDYTGSDIHKMLSNRKLFIKLIKENISHKSRCLRLPLIRNRVNPSSRG